jgi:hypothetical protein
MIPLWVIFWGACLFYIFGCITLWQIGKKFGIGTPGAYFVPIRNMALLCRCAEVSAWHVLFCCIPILNGGALIWIWGNLARRMGRSFWLYGLFCPSLFLPVLVLAYGGAMPVGASPAENHTPLPAPDHEAESALELECVAGELSGEHVNIPFDAGSAMVIGRNPQNAHLVIRHAHVSGKHASVWCERDASGAVRVKLLDLNSTNGTQYRVAGGKWTSLRASEVALGIGDGVRISDAVEFRIARTA